MGQAQSIPKLNFEAVQTAINDREIVVINTLDVGRQNCLIKNTVPADKEAELFNDMIKQGKNKTAKILIYGENCSDFRVIDKYNQLHKLGFINLSVYCGGLFEWLLLQDIYGDDEFQTTSHIIDILAYAGRK